MSYLNSNLAALAKKDLILADSIHDFSIKDLTVLSARRSQDPTLKAFINGETFFIHSVYDPREEANKFIFAKSFNEQVKVVILYGFGLGYIPEAFFNIYPKLSHLIVVEPNLGILRLALESRNLTELLAFESFHLIAGFPQNLISKLLALQSEFSSFSTSQIQILIYPPSLRSTPPEYFEILNHFEFVAANQKSELRHPKHTLYQEHFKAQLDDNSNLPDGISKLWGKFKNLSAVLIGAGPSLNKNLNTLVGAENRVLLFCVDVALKTLLKHGIYPQFVLSLDPGMTPEFFRDCEKFHGIFLHPPGLNPSVAKLFSRERRLIFFREEEVNTPGLEKYSQNDILEKHPNVLSMGLGILKKMGVNPVLLAGSDLAIRPDATHVDGVENAGVVVKDWSALREIEGYFGSTVRTTLAFYLYLRHIESYLLANPELEVINCTEGGAKISYTHQAPLAESIAAFSGNSLGNIIEKSLKP